MNRFVGKTILLGVASIWEERKGLNDFIALSSVLPMTIQIILVGLNRKQLANLPVSIIGIERTNNVQKLAKLYSLADIHLALSQEETFGMTIAESMSCGTPVITYDTSATAELVTKDTGLIVEQGNIEQLVFAINHLLSKGKLFYREACIKRVLQLYNKDKQFAEYLDLYNQKSSDENYHHYRLP